MNIRDCVPEQCKSIFVGWKFFVSVLITLVGAIAVVAYSYGTQMATVNTKLAGDEKELSELQTSINNKLDILVSRGDKQAKLEKLNKIRSGEENH